MSLNTDYGLPHLCRATGCEVSRCFYCGNLLSPRHEHDHFPVPARAGGNRVVPACYNCHDLKDRVLFVKWPVELAWEGITDLMTVLVPDPGQLSEDALRNPLATVFSAVALNLGLHEQPQWRTLSVPGRLLFAKIAHRVTGDLLVGTTDRQAGGVTVAWTDPDVRRDLLSPWVDRTDARYSDAGPTLSGGAVVTGRN